MNILDAAHSFIESQSEDYEDVSLEGGQIRTKTLSQIGLLGRKSEDIQATLQLLADYKAALIKEITKMEAQLLQIEN